jgi:citrate lyase subunit beta/citryl-CoA lyase
LQSRPFRSLLFVPATKPDWFRKAAESQADAIIIDLEDAVAEREKSAAREFAARGIAEISESGKGTFVRINPLTSTHWLEDLRAVVQPQLTGIAVPKVESPADIECVAHVLDALEAATGLASQAIDIQPLLETARSMIAAHAILSASPRIHSYFGGSARDGDVNRELGSRWRPDGHETLFIRSHLLLQGRAAGVPFPVSGTWTEIADLQGLTRLAQESRDLGYAGMYVIHPTHIDAVNAAFTPTAEELDRYRAIISAYAAAERDGHGTATMSGSLIDKAMLDRAQAVLGVAQLTEASQEGNTNLWR